jgi:MICOS complex subunit MIC19
MGQSNNKPRTLSMDAEADDSIDVSDDVVKRLKTGLKGKSSKQQVCNVFSPLYFLFFFSSLAENKQKEAPKSDVQPPKLFDRAPLAPAQINRSQIYTTMEARKEKEAALAANDKFWRSRIGLLEANFQKSNKINEDEFFAAIDEINKRFDSPTNSIRQIPPCQDLKSKLMDCYVKNKNETLLCSQEARDFVNCVGLHRINLLDNKAP